ncbi:MAG: PLP-dependent aminotransferase family protein, partial [Clostridiales bacterium]|nr:PLP-dependent aminotransferase family protein [Clostridiales bacterium]
MIFRCSERMESLKPSTIREMLKYISDPTVISLAGGNPSADLFPAKQLAEVTADVLKNDAGLALQYGKTEGYPPLIKQIRQRLKTKYGIDTPGDEILVTHGGQQVIDLATKCLVNEGDTVIAENPSFIGALNTFRSFKANIAGIPMDNEGMVIEHLENALKTEKNVKLIYTIPTFQNPMGVTMTPERRRRLYELSVQYNVPVIEDSPYFELAYSGEV